MRAIVTGGGGFLGGRIVELLRARGDEVTVLCRGQYPAVEALGASLVQVDLRNASRVRAAVGSADAVFHVAGKTGPWGDPAEFHSINVDGTRNLLAAVRSTGIPRLIHTSTPSVVGYDRDVENGGADLPHAATHESPYAESKAAAERLVLAANGGGLATVVLRPHLIIGPGDHQMLPRVVRRAAEGGLRIVGDGRNRVDLTYVDNAAWAHLDAAAALSGPDAGCAGKTYFISNGEPVRLWDWINGVLRDLGLPPAESFVPYGAARLAGAVAEHSWRALRLEGEPPLTRFLAGALARSHWYDLEPARRDLGYRVRIPMDEATRLTVRWLREIGAHSPQRRDR